MKRREPIEVRVVVAAAPHRAIALSVIVYTRLSRYFRLLFRKPNAPVGKAA